MYSRVFSDFLNLDCSSRSSDDALDAEEEAEEENDDDEGGATDEAAVLEDEAGGMMDEKLQFQMILSFDDLLQLRFVLLSAARQRHIFSINLQEITCQKRETLLLINF